MAIMLVVKPASLKSLIDKNLPPQPCHIDKILPKGGTLLFGGHAKIGKSFIMLELARALSMGENPFNCPFMKVHEPCKVLLIEQELGEYGLQKRVKRVFAEQDQDIYGKKVYYVSKIPEMQLDSQEGRKLLFDLVDEVRPNVLLLDPISRMHSYDENKNDQIQQLFSHLEGLVKIFSENDMSLVISHHFGKPSSDPKSTRDPLDPYNFRGSSKWFDNPDSLITVARLEDLDTTWKAWNLQFRFETRQDESPNDIRLTFNKENDNRVKFVKSLGERDDKKDSKIVNKPADSPVKSNGKQGKLFAAV